MKTCKNKDCGRSNPDNAKYCKGCGRDQFNEPIETGSGSSALYGWGIFFAIVIVIIMRSC